MRKLGGTLVTLLLLAAPALAGCGDDKKEGTAATRAGGAVTSAPAPKNKLPAELAGTWASRLNGAELADLAPAALTEKNLVFTIRFVETGGVDNGPSVLVGTDDLDMEFASSVTVSGDRITLNPAECQFAYAVKAEQITLTSIGDDCPHDGLSSVLTAGPWEQTTGSDSQSRIPERLAGTWQATIESSRVVDAPVDLTKGHSVWRLKFLGTGGEDNGPSMFLSNEQVGELVYSISLSGDEITLQSGTDCQRFVFVELETEKLQIRSTEQDRGCPSTLVSSVLQRPWRLVESGPSRRERTTAEGSLASKEAFVDCARRRDELGIIVDFRDGQAVPEPSQDVGSAEVDTRVSVPQAIAEVLADSGQYVGLREGVGPDVDIVFHGRLPGAHEDDVYTEVYTPLTRLMEEAAKEGIISWNHGDYSELDGSQEWVIVRQGDPPGWDENLGVLRVPRALKPLVPCFRQAIWAADRLIGH